MTNKNKLNKLELQPASIDIWAKKYQLKNKDNTPIDHCIDDTFKRVAKALSMQEKEELRDIWEKEFLWAMENGAIPAGRILSNAGAIDQKSETSTINCVVSGIIQDSMDDILTKVRESGLSLKVGNGIGYEFSTLRPKDAYVSGAGANTSGPLSFMDIYDKMCFTISSAGGRRGAQMATFDVCHPDILDFIKAKRETGRFRQFNCSVLITNDFIDAVKNDKMWFLSFPIQEKEVLSDNLDLSDKEKFIYREFPITENYVVNKEGLVACKIYNKVKAKTIWNVIMTSTYDYAEPGFLLIDNINKDNNNWFCENLRATNPCGEQPLPPYGSCLLGSINLTKFVTHPFTDKASFDYGKYIKVIKIFTRMLDNVVEINGLVLQQQKDEILSKRRHGMGYLGLGSTLTMLGIKYGSKASIDFTDNISKTLAYEGWKVGLELAKEKGPAPIMEQDFIVTDEMLYKRPEMILDGYKVGNSIKGKVLHARYSKYMQKISTIDNKLIEELAQVGCRYTHHTSLAPTGCVVGNTWIVTENGLEKIKRLGDTNGDTWQDISLDVSTDEGYKKADKFFINGIKPTYKIYTSSGKKMEATLIHQNRIIGEEGYEWKKFSDFKLNDIIPTIVDNYPEVVKPYLLNEISNKYNNEHYFNRSNFINPKYLNEDIAEFIGFLYSNGNTKGNRCIRLYHNVEYSSIVFNKIKKTLKDNFNLDSFEHKSIGEKYLNLDELHIHSKDLVSWLLINNFYKPLSPLIMMPEEIAKSGRNIIYSFLRGYFEGDGTVSNSSISVSSQSNMFLSDLQILMQSVGIVSKKSISIYSDYKNRYGTSTLYRLQINNLIDRKRFVERVGFMSSKNEKIIFTSERNCNRRKLDNDIKQKLSFYLDKTYSGDFNSKLKQFEEQFNCELYYEKIISIELSEALTYDISVPENVTYTANNFISHNTISLSIANNASNGIEPSFAHKYFRNVIIEGKNTKEKMDVYSFEFLAYKELINSNVDIYTDVEENKLPDYFIVCDDITPKAHIDIQSAAQYWIDSSISKTCNVPTDIPFKDFENTYMYGHEMGLKGCTTFRFNPEAFSGVLVKDKDLENTLYEFTLEDGSTVQFKGNEEIEYDGEMHSVSNLYDALKEGYYGKF